MNGRPPGCRLAWLLIATSLLLAARGSVAQGHDALELMRQVQRQASAPDEAVQFTMTLVDASGRTRERTGTVHERAIAAGSVEQKRLIRFQSPPDIRGSGVLTIEHPDRDSDQWLYLPAYHTTRRIAPANRGDRYMGTDFVYEDLTREKLEEYRYRVTGEETIAGVRCLIIEGVPVAEQLKRETAYSRKLMWVDPVRALILKVEYDDREEKFFKRLVVTETETVTGRHRSRAVRVEDFRRHHATVVTYHSRRIGAGVPERYFTEHYLRRPE